MLHLCRIFVANTAVHGIMKQSCDEKNACEHCTVIHPLRVPHICAEEVGAITCNFLSKREPDTQAALLPHSVKHDRYIYLYIIYIYIYIL